MQHGGAGTAYVHNGCRCELCTQANAARARRGQEKRMAITAANGGIPPTEKHGDTTYVNWGCRCEVCTVAHRKQWQKNYAERKARAMND